jgi:hypothetical protein
MPDFDFNNKTFVLLKNSESGLVDTGTLFRYKQDGELVTAGYSGGSILHGSIVAVLAGNRLEMLYHCLTTAKELRAGRAAAVITTMPNGKIKLSLDWEWLTGPAGRGQSEYIEAG